MIQIDVLASNRYIGYLCFKVVPTLKMPTRVSAGCTPMRQNQCPLTDDVLDAGEMDRRKELNDFYKGKLLWPDDWVRASRSGKGGVGCSRSAMTSAYQQWSEEGQTTNPLQGVGNPRLIEGQRMLSLLVRTHRRAIVSQVTENLNDGYRTTHAYGAVWPQCPC